MKQHNENFRYSPSDPPTKVLADILQGVKDPMNSMDSLIQMLELLIDNKQQLEASLPGIIETLATVFDKMKFVVDVARIYQEESGPKQQ